MTALSDSNADWRNPALQLDDLGAIFVEATWRANHTRASAWLDGLGLHEARRRWRAGVAFAEIDHDRWEPADRRNGRRVVVLPALDPWQAEPDFLDLVAVEPDRPLRWLTLYGRAVVLGDALGFLFGMTRVHVHAEPLAWARAAGAGVCIVDIGKARPLLVDRGLELVVDDIATGEAIERELRRPENLPRIAVRQQVAA